MRWCPAAPGGDGDLDGGHRQPPADQQGQREDQDVVSHSGHPRTAISLVMVAVGLPSGPGTNSRLAIASPALKADSTAATAMDCHSTIAARGARSSYAARASRAGTGPTSNSATSAKASADTLPVSPQPVGVPPADPPDRCLASNSASARRRAAASSAPTRSTKCTSAACRSPESAAWSRASTMSPATSSSRPWTGVY